jgi:sigma54-dependent transcription regulator
MALGLNSKFMAEFQQSFAAFHILIADSCIFLCFLAAAPKLPSLLITTSSSKSKNSNRIQREFLFNNGIQSQNLSSASKHQREKKQTFSNEARRNYR